MHTVVKVGSDVPLCTPSLRWGVSSPLCTVVKEGSDVPLCTVAGRIDAPHRFTTQPRLQAGGPGYCAPWQVLHLTRCCYRRRSPHRRYFHKTRSLVLRAAPSLRSPRRRASVRLRPGQPCLRRLSFLLLYSCSRWRSERAARMVPFIRRAWALAFLLPFRPHTCGQPRRLLPWQPRLLRLPLQLLVPLLPTRRAVHQPLSRPPLGQIRLSYPNFDLDHRLSRCRSSSGVSIGRTQPRRRFPHPARTDMPLQSLH